MLKNAKEMLENKLMTSICLFLVMMIGIFSLSICEATSPGWIPLSKSQEGHIWNMDLSIFGGYVTGRSQELVFNPTNPNQPYQISQLDWKLGHLWVIGGRATLSFLDSRLHLSVGGWNKIHSNRTQMIDRDFFDPADPSKVTDISWHPNTQLKTAWEIEAEIDYDFYCLCHACHELKIGFLAGYNRLKFHWKSFGGTFSYKNGTDNGSFTPGELVIAYTQKFSVPFLGLQLNWAWHPCFTMRFFGKYSGWTFAQDRDFHALRGILFVDKFNGSHYWMTGVEMHWQTWEWLSLDLRYSYDRLNTSTGKTITIVNGEQIPTADTAGIRHFHHFISLGLTSHF